MANAAMRYGLTMNGRAPSSFAPQMERHPVATLVSRNPSGCRELLQTRHAHLNPYGNYVPPGRLRDSFRIPLGTSASAICAIIFASTFCARNRRLPMSRSARVLSAKSGEVGIHGNACRARNDSGNEIR